MTKNMNLGWWLKKSLSEVKAAEMRICEEWPTWRFAKKCAAVKFVKPERGIVLNKEITAAMVRPCYQNDRGKIGETCPAIAAPMGKWPRGWQRTRWRDYMLWSRLDVESAKESNDCWKWKPWCSLRRVFPRCCPRDPDKRKSGVKMNEWMSKIILFI